MPIEKGANPLTFDGINAAFATTYKQLVNGDPVKCDKTNTIYDSHPAPTAVVLDVSKIDLGVENNPHNDVEVLWQGTLRSCSIRAFSQGICLVYGFGLVPRLAIRPCKGRL